MYFGKRSILALRREQEKLVFLILLAWSQMILLVPIIAPALAFSLRNSPISLWYTTDGMHSVKNETTAHVWYVALFLFDCAWLAFFIWRNFFNTLILILIPLGCITSSTRSLRYVSHITLRTFVCFCQVAGL